MNIVNVEDQAHGDGWSLYLGDCVSSIAGIPDSSIGFSVYSPPFSLLYCYSPSERDLGNCRSHAEFFEHYRFLLRELLRVLKPGRNMSVHCFDIPSMKMRDGFIGLVDFPGDIIRSAQEIGWIWHARVTIRKDPVRQMQRTKALGLLHKQLLKDSTMSRMGIADYVLTFRKPGANPEPVSHTREEYPVVKWQGVAEPVWMDIDESDTLNERGSKDDDDGRHVAPLQLDVIRRCIELWSNPQDIVLSPFAGIGSEGVVSLEMGRKFIGFELKKLYWQIACRNLAAAEPNAIGKQASIFDILKEQGSAEAT